MTRLPPPVLNYLLAETIGSRSLAYVFVGNDGTLGDWGGQLEDYGIAGLEKGRPVSEVIFHLEGLFPPVDEAFAAPVLLMPFVEIAPDTFADIHVCPDAGGYWVVLVDKTAEVDQQQRFQQKGNELILLREKQAKILDQYLGKEIAERLASGLLTVKEGGERRDLTILFADIRAFTPFSEQNTAEDTFETLNLYLQSMIQPILAQDGMIDKIIGDAVMALFGVIPSEKLSPVNAVAAAVRMIESVKVLNECRVTEERLALQVGIGIASGSVALGILGTRARRTVSVIGHHVNLAARLEGLAQPMEILIDENTFAELDTLKRLFLRRRVALKGLAEPVTTYSRQVR